MGMVPELQHSPAKKIHVMLFLPCYQKKKSYLSASKNVQKNASQVSGCLIWTVAFSEKHMSYKTSIHSQYGLMKITVHVCMNDTSTTLSECRNRQRQPTRETIHFLSRRNIFILAWASRDRVISTFPSLLRKLQLWMHVRIAVDLRMDFHIIPPSFDTCHTAMPLYLGKTSSSESITLLEYIFFPRVHTCAMPQLNIVFVVNRISNLIKSTSASSKTRSFDKVTYDNTE